MAPKRPAPPAASSALPSGTAFRKSAAKKQRKEPVNGGDAGEKSAPPSTTDANTHQNVMGGKGKAKARPQQAPKAKVQIKKPGQVKEPVQDKQQARVAGKAASLGKHTNAAQKGKAKSVARFEVAPSTSKAKAGATADKTLPGATAATEVAPPLDSFRIVVGSYERLLYGIHVTFPVDEEPRPTFKTMFSFAAHTSCISAVAAAGADSKWLATGAGDETVRVWDLRKRKEVGGLTGHNGTIHSLSFPARTYLLSGDSSGLINLYRTRDWSLLKTLRGHTGKVNACVAHPSGKIALSVGKDGMLRMWDLMRGKGAGAVRLNLGQEEGSRTTFKEEPLDVKWNESGSRFAVMGRTEVVVYKTDMTRIASILVRRDDPKRKLGCVEWQGDEVLLTGNEMGLVEVYRLGEGQIEGPICRLVGHANRVREVRAIKLQLRPGVDMVVATTISSDGKIRLYNVTEAVQSKTSSEAAKDIEPMGTHDTGGARLTCLDVVGGAGGSTSTDDALELEADTLDDDDGETELDQAEIEELYDLLDLVEEAKRQGIAVEGMSDLDEGDEGVEGSEDSDSDLDDDYDDEGSDLDGLESEGEAELESEGEAELESEAEEEAEVED